MDEWKYGYYTRKYIIAASKKNSERSLKIQAWTGCECEPPRYLSEAKWYYLPTRLRASHLLREIAKANDQPSL